MNRRDVLKVSAATGAVGMLAGCTASGGLLPGSEKASDEGSMHSHGCPEIAGRENGFVWVHKQASGPWLGDLTISGDEPYATADDSNTVSGTANIGQGRVELHEAGEYTFRYMVDSQELTWVEEPRTLVSMAFPDGPYEENGLVTGANIIDYSVYPYSSTDPLKLTFEVDEPGIYRIAYGPANGAFLFEEWLPNLDDRQHHLRLGVGIEGDRSRYSWVYPEVPEHVSAWFGEDRTVVSREPHPPDIECELEPGDI